MLLLSIIIPCYNSGKFLPDALQSIKHYPDTSVYEVIIVDDGSTDEDTLAFLGSLSASDYTVIHQENKGSAAARNTGIRAAKGDYILFLDSDNKIRPAYIATGISILSSQPAVGVVHGNAAFFGLTTEIQFVPQKFNMHKMLMGNYIDMCTIIRKRVWKEVNGLDEDRNVIGHEDWDFWLRIGATQWQFYYLNETVFDYRVRENSLIRQAQDPVKYQEMIRYMYSKNLSLLLENYRYIHGQLNIYQYDQSNPLRSFIKYLYYKYFKSISFKQWQRSWSLKEFNRPVVINYAHQ